jgi:hypothetical protein
VVSEYEDLLEAYIEARQHRDEAEAEFRKFEEKLVIYMEEHRRKNLELDDGEHVSRVTYTQSTQVKVDEEGLKKHLTAPVFNKYTVRKLDRKALEKAIDEGAISSLSVTPYITVAKTKPFLKYTIKDSPDDGDGLSGTE